jgi:predicted transposase YdaD
VLCGLRYDAEQVAALYRSLSMTLEDSSVYQMALGKGVTQGLAQGLVQGSLRGTKDTIVRVGAKRFGPPSEAVQAAIDAITDAVDLGRIADRLLDATGWDDLIATP